MSEPIYVSRHPLIEKFDEAFQITTHEVVETYKRKAHSEASLKYVLAHAKNIISKFSKYFNRVCDLQRIIKYVKMKRKKFGKERIEYAKFNGLPEYDENLIDICLRFLRNYHGEIKCMKLLLI